MKYSEATVLAKRIKSEYPQYSPVVVPLTDGLGYGVNISWWTFRYDTYCCLDYARFVKYAQESDFEVDIPDNGKLIKPVQHTYLLKSKAHWALHQMANGEAA